MSTCKQIRAEASDIYGKNRLEVCLFNFNVTRLVDWMRDSPPRLALYENLEVFLTTLSGRNTPEKHGGDPWPNILKWIKLYRQGRCRRIVDPEPKHGQYPWSNDQVDLVVKIFDLVDELLENDSDMSMAKLNKAVSIHRRAIKRYQG